MGGIGQRLTKRCSACNSDKHIGEYHRDPAQPDGRHHRCKSCKAVSNGVTNSVHNSISAIAYRLAGSCAKFYLLAKEERALLRAQARALHAADANPNQPMTATEVVARERLPFVPRSAPPTRPFRERDARGYVYVVINRAWPGLVKIGCTGDCQKRLQQYNTGSPYRDYEMVHHVYNNDRRAAEKSVHDTFGKDRHKNEWFWANITEAMMALEAVREVDPNETTCGVTS